MINKLVAPSGLKYLGYCETASLKDVWITLNNVNNKPKRYLLKNFSEDYKRQGFLAVYLY